MAEIKQVFTIIENDVLKKKKWIPIGIAFVNKDDSLNIRLDALPVNGLLHVRTPMKKPISKPEEPNPSSLD